MLKINYGSLISFRHLDEDSEMRLKNPEKASKLTSS